MARILILALVGALAMPAQAEERFVTVASTTSTQNSGLLDAILPIFTEKTGIGVRVVAVGTGQAIRIARNGDADVLLVHHRQSEDAFVADGYGVERHDVMYNDFVILGPRDDPAGVVGSATAAEALTRIAAAGVPFLSRGDDSGTHKKEQELWRAAGIVPDGPWYRETGSGMGTTLNMGVVTGAYVLSDRGTWITFGNPQEHAILMSGDPALFNPYGMILVNPDRFAHVKAADGQALIDWMTGPEGQAAIADFRISGWQAFCPVSAPGAQAEDEGQGETCPADPETTRDQADAIGERTEE